MVHSVCVSKISKTTNKSTKHRILNLIMSSRVCLFMSALFIHNTYFFNQSYFIHFHSHTSFMSPKAILGCLQWPKCNLQCLHLSQHLSCQSANMKPASPFHCGFIPTLISGCLAASHPSPNTIQWLVKSLCSSLSPPHRQIIGPLSTPEGQKGAIYPPCPLTQGR